MENGVSIEDARDTPRVVWRHVDGPVLSWAGHVHWLTWRERWLLLTRRTTIDLVAQQHWPQRRAWV